MKKTLLILTLLVAAAPVSFVYAQVPMQGSESHRNSGGGLGQGITHMVRNILDEQAAPAESVQMKSSAADTRLLSAASMSMRAPEPFDEDDLERALHAALEADVRVAKIVATSTKVSVTYGVPGKFLGVLRLSVPTTATVTTEGVKISYPWYALVSGTARKHIAARVHEAVAPALQDAAGGSFDLRMQARIVEALIAAFQTSVR